MGFVSYMILVWDHIATFDDEVLLPNVGRSRMLLTLSGVQVEYIWKGKKGPRKRIMNDLLLDHADDLNRSCMAIWYREWLVPCGSGPFS